jgi:hypothetical protein
MAVLEQEEKQVKEFAFKKMVYHQREARKWRSIVEALSASLQEDLFPTEKDKSKPIIMVRAKPKTLRERCESTLIEMDVPLTSRDLKKEVEERFKKKYPFNTFSGSFSQSYRAKSSLIEKYDVPKPSLHVKSVYCLKSWFDDTGELRDEYKNKIKKRYFN